MKSHLVCGGNPCIVINRLKMIRKAQNQTPSPKHSQNIGTNSKRNLSKLDNLMIAKNSAIFLEENLRANDVITETNVFNIIGYHPRIKEKIKSPVNTSNRKAEHSFRSQKSERKLAQSVVETKRDGEGAVNNIKIIRSNEANLASFLKRMEEKEYYKNHIYDEERIKDSTRYMSMQKVEIDFYKRQLLIDEYFSNEPSFVKRN